MATKTNSQEIVNKPDYGKIFKEMAQKNKISESGCKRIIEVKNWDCLDVIEVNDLLFAFKSKENIKFNQCLKAYDESSIKKILEYKRQSKLNNSEMMRLFGVSRNTLTRWNKIF